MGEDKKNIGLFFGSFNPITVGHLYVAQNILESSANIDEIWFVVSPKNPDKDENSLAKGEDRLEMVKQSLTQFGNDKLRAEDIEFDLPLPNYTYRSIKHIRRNYTAKFIGEGRNLDFTIIVGEDVYEGITNWTHYEKLCGEKLLVFPRHAEAPLLSCELKENSIETLEEIDDGANATLLGISSTIVRDRIENNKSIAFLVPDIVKDYIKMHKLYIKN